jgi:hypothetical protein
MPGDVLTELQILADRMERIILDLYFIIDYLEDHGFSDRTEALMERREELENIFRGTLAEYFFHRRELIRKEAKEQK